MIAKWIWWTLTITGIVWYSTVTVYVAVLGGRNIKSMLRRLATHDDLHGDITNTTEPGVDQ